MTRGGASLMAGLVVAVVAVVGVATASLGLAFGAAEQARTAAEAGALAAAVATYPPAGGGRTPVAEAARYVAANGASLRRCQCRVDRTLQRRTVLVMAVVRVRLPLFGELGVPGAARAEFDPRSWLGR